MYRYIARSIPRVYGIWDAACEYVATLIKYTETIFYNLYDYYLDPNDMMEIAVFLGICSS